jgi:hypothetical protein
MKGVRLVDPCGMPFVVWAPVAARLVADVVVVSLMTPRLGAGWPLRLEHSRHPCERAARSPVVRPGGAGWLPHGNGGFNAG